MKTSAVQRLVFFISVAGALAACGGSKSPAVLPTQTRGQSRPSSAWVPNGSLVSLAYKVTAPSVYVTNINFRYNDVQVYRADAKDPAPLATISDGIDTPSGDCVDGSGTLYVTNEPASSGGWISEYPLGKTSPSKIIKDGISTPAFCAIDGKGNLWVTNIGLDNVTEYLYGSKKPHTVITNGLTYPDGIAIDHQGNTYVGNLEPYGTSNVQVYRPDKKSPSRTITDGITWPVGIAVDSNATLYVANAQQNNVEEYRSGEDHPFQTITDAMDDPLGVTANRRGRVYVANAGSNSVAEFPARRITPSKRQISKGLSDPLGVAYYPPLLP